MALFESSQLWLNLARLTVLFFTGFIAWLTYRSYLLLQEIRPDFNLLLSLPESLARLLMVVFCLGLAWVSGLPAAQLGLVASPLWSALGLGVAVGLLTQLVINLITQRAIKHFGRGIYSPWLIHNILPENGREWLLVALAFIPSVLMEELLFRSLWLGLFESLIPMPLLIILTSIVFGLMHQPQGKLGVTVAGIINALFSVLFIWSGTLIVTLVAHYIVNMLQVVVAHYQRDWLEQYLEG